MVLYCAEYAYLSIRLSVLVLSKDPVLRYHVGTKKMQNVTVPGFVKYLWYRVPGQPGSWRIGPYDFLVSSICKY